MRIVWVMRVNNLEKKNDVTTKKKKLISSDFVPLFRNSGDFSLLFGGRKKFEAIAK